MTRWETKTNTSAQHTFTSVGTGLVPNEIIILVLIQFSSMLKFHSCLQIVEQQKSYDGRFFYPMINYMFHLLGQMVGKMENIRFHLVSQVNGSYSSVLQLKKKL